MSNRHIDVGIFTRKAEKKEPQQVQQPQQKEVGPVISADAISAQFQVSNERGNGVKESNSVVEQESVPQEQPQVEQPVQENEGPVNIIDLNHITQIFNKGQKNEYKLFEDFNLSVEDIPEVGQLVSFMGASGCGKSRLVRAICGLDTVQSGDIRIYGKPLSEYDKNIPMVFQTYSNYEWMTVLENVMLPMRLRKVPKKEAKEKALELLDIVGLSEHADKYPHKLSGGQQQRVSIARSLACNSQIIVFDEATGALDIKMKREVQNIILKIFYESEFDPTILNITHSIEEAAYLSNVVYILQPNPCKVYKKIEIRYTGEETKRRGEWIFETQEYANYIKQITQAMDEVCR